MVDEPDGSVADETIDHLDIPRDSRVSDVGSDVTNRVSVCESDYNGSVESDADSPRNSLTAPAIDRVNLKFAHRMLFVLSPSRFYSVINPPV